MNEEKTVKEIQNDIERKILEEILNSSVSSDRMNLIGEYLTFKRAVEINL